jgi:hypothetical protein
MHHLWFTRTELHEAVSLLFKRQPICTVVAAKQFTSNTFVVSEILGYRKWSRALGLRCIQYARSELLLRLAARTPINGEHELN